MSSQPEQRQPFGVVVVDDDPMARRIAKICLSFDEAFNVVGEAASGEEAILVASLTQPDLVLLDLEMPGMDGLTAIPEIRAAAPKAKIAVLSSFPDPYTLSDALRKGADTYLDKAMELSTLAEVLRALAEPQAS